MSQTKVFAKGHIIFKEGDRLTHLYFIQSGSVQCQWARGKKAMELTVWGPGQVLGDFCFTQTTAPYQAIAVNEVKAIEIPLDGFLKQWDALPQPIKIFNKSISDRIKWAIAEIKNYRAEKESMPCGDEIVTKVFASFYYAAKAKAKPDAKNPNDWFIEWPLMRQYAQRVFAESPKRMEQVLNVLAKHGFAKVKMGVPPENPEGPEEIREVSLKQSDLTEKFFEFYQYFYFKGGKQEALKFDETLFHILTAFVELAERFPEKDRQGFVNIPYAEVLKHLKEGLGINLNNDHFLRFDGKGVMVNRKTMSDGQVFLQFQPAEVIQCRWNWVFLKEIERWNERGFVDLAELVLPKKPTANQATNTSQTAPCPECQAEVALSAKFCPECGCKLNRAAA